MTLLIAILVIVGLDMSGWWIPAAAIVWCVHLWFHDDSALSNGINNIIQRQHKTGVFVQQIKEKLSDD